MPCPALTPRAIHHGGREDFHHEDQAGKEDQAEPTLASVVSHEDWHKDSLQQVSSALAPWQDRSLKSHMSRWNLCCAQCRAVIRAVSRFHSERWSKGHEPVAWGKKKRPSFAVPFFFWLGLGCGTFVVCNRLACKWFGICWEAARALTLVFWGETAGRTSLHFLVLQMQAMNPNRQKQP